MKRSYLPFLLCLIFHQIKAQPEQIRFKRLSIEEGLSQSTVKAILNDSKGYMWFGTRDGLNRYDGNKITIYRHNPKDSTTVSSSDINFIFEDRSNNLWIATTRAIDRFDRQKEIFIHYKTSKENIDASMVTQDKRGDLWLASRDGLHKFNAKENRFTLFHIQPDTVRTDIPKIMEDDQGFLWIGSLWFIAKFDPATETIKYFSHDPKNPKSLGLGFHPKPFQDKDGRIWIGLNGGGLCLYNPSDDSFTRYLHEPANPNSLCHNEVLSIDQGENGRLWIGTQNGGISIFDYKKNRFTTLRQNINNPTTLSNNSIHSLYRDRSNNMWVGTWAGGVNLYSRYGNKFTNYKGVLHFDNPNIYVVRGDVEDNIWLGPEDGGLVRFDRKTGNFIPYPNQHAKEFLTTVIFSLSEYNKDTLIIGYHRGSFAFFDKRRKLFTHYFPKEGEPHSSAPSPPIPGNLIGHTKTCVLKDRDGNVWVTDWGSGVNFRDKKTKKFTNYLQDLKDSTSLNGNDVFVVYEDKQGNIWIGTDRGLNRFDKKTKRFIRYQKKSSSDLGVSNSVFSLFEDSRGIFWVGTAGSGLLSLDRQTNSFVRHKELEGLPNKVIDGILEDEKGNLWISTNKGLSRYHPLEKTLRNYDVKDGLQGDEFNRNACYQAPDGVMFFAGTNGFNVFHPDSVQDNPYIPPVVITDLQLFNKSVLPAQAGSVLKSAINQTREVTLSYQHSVFSLEFAALDFTVPIKNQYAYKMENFDKNWVYAGNRNMATYTNLDPGTYTFRVKASNNDGKWNEQGTSLVVHILPPWWKTWWFKILVALVVISGAFTFYRVRIDIITNQKKLLEEEVAIRTTELREANADLKTTNEKVSAQKEEIETQSEAMKDLYTELNSSIRAAESIQQTILTSATHIKDYFPESFIFYKPKDVVSGDFYWFNVVNDALVLAAVDCTGHGVSGAIMSIHAYHLLNQAIDSLGTVSPDEVLERLNKIVHKEFTQKENENEKTPAGMDVAMCVIDKAKKRLQFSGAVNPVYILRDKEIIQIKGNKYPIGLLNQDGKKMFSKQEVELKRGDKVYIFSDGYSDQFGGENGDEKFMYFRFRELLVAMTDTRMPDQADVLEETLNQWKGKLDQMDDILVIGMEI